ncbi:ferredoxin [Brevibacterium sanguinis]|uniref:Ferredoxin n=2 Tax=Brevibacterium TaxID=1696 RepID=A0A366ILG4_9MICO|nr:MULTISPECIES: ferredoxin [Brevibacterium]RBP67033.1 ferredoxin [Brevibacterium sanguinis]RBP73558.1 ferredoxin [Brevibacterium celere]
MEITVHSSMCVASGNCGHVAPAVFANPEENDGFVELLDAHPPESQWVPAREAEYLCPSKAIQIDGHAVPPDRPDPPGRSDLRGRPDLPDRRSTPADGTQAR